VAFQDAIMADLQPPLTSMERLFFLAFTACGFYSEGQMKLSHWTLCAI
jgi:hypothetical protein